MKKKKVKDDGPWFMLVKGGKVQWHKHGEFVGMLVSRQRENLTKLAKQHNASIAEIGTGPGETLEGQVAVSKEQGANSFFVVTDPDHYDRVEI